MERELVPSGKSAKRGPLRDVHDHRETWGEVHGSWAATTLGWKPTCKCESHHNETEYVVPCTVLDPFAGSGTTGAVALELGRKAVLIELNPKYVQLIEERCNVTPGLQLA